MLNIDKATAMIREYVVSDHEGSRSVESTLLAALYRSIAEGLSPSFASGVPAAGVKVYDCLCDWRCISSSDRYIKTDGIVSVISDAAAAFGPLGDDVADVMRKAITAAFATPDAESEGLTSDQSNMILLALRVLQQNLRGATAEIVASEIGVTLPSSKEIGELCEYINSGGV